MHLSIVCLVISFVSELALGNAITNKSPRRKNRLKAAAVDCTFVDSPGSTCGATGTFDYYYTGIADDSMVPNLAACRQLCGNRIPAENADVQFSCESFAYDSSSGLCSLYTRPVKDQAFRADPTSSNIVYDRSCIFCPSSCPDTGVDNMFDNAGFEFSTTAIGPWVLPPGSAADGRVVPRSASGGNAYFCPDGSYFTCTIEQYRRLCIGQVYKVTANLRYSRARAGSSLPSVYLTASEFSSSFSWTNISELVSSLTLTYSFQAKSGGSETLPRFEYYLADTFDETNAGPANPNLPPGVYADGFRLEVVPTTYNTQGGNLVPNGGFESGSIAPWTYSWRQTCYQEYCDNRSREGTAEIRSPGLTSGSSSAFRYSGGFIGNIGLVSRSFNTVKGQRYLLRLNYRLVQFTTLIQVNGASWQPEGYGAPSGNVTRFFEREFTADSDTGVVRMFFRNSVDGKGEIIVDNVRVLALA